jgi:hypothetical protein
MSEYTWGSARCPCCYKKVQTVLGPLCNETVAGWSNLMTRTRATALARDGVCPWCGQRTTIVARILLGRFEPRLASYEREGLMS